MNNLNKELAVKAGFAADDYDMFESIFEKYAQLIVQECADQCNITRENMRAEDPFWEAVANQCRYDIKEHFGIE